MPRSIPGGYVTSGGKRKSRNCSTHLRMVRYTATSPANLTVVEDGERTNAVCDQRDLERVALKEKKTYKHQAISKCSRPVRSKERVLSLATSQLKTVR